MNNILEVKTLVKSYNKNEEVVKGINFSINSGVRFLKLFIYD